MSMILSVAELAKMQPSPIKGVAGKIEKLFPIERPTGWNFQNGYMRDPVTGDEIRFQFKNWKRVVDPAEYQGGFIEIVATDEKSLVWKKQKSDKPLVKLEIAETAQIVKLMTAADYRAKGATSAAASAPNPSRVAVPDAPTPFPVASPPASAAIQSKPTVGGSNAAAVDLVHQLGALFVLCEDEAATLLHKERSAPEVRPVAETIFTQASASGVHEKIDVATFWLMRDPDVASKMGFGKPVSWTPAVAEIANLVGDSPERERLANEMLVQAKYITAAQTWRDLPDERAAEVLKQGFFKLAVSAAA